MTASNHAKNQPDDLTHYMEAASKLRYALRRIRAMATKRIEESDAVIIAEIDSIAMEVLDE